MILFVHLKLQIFFLNDPFLLVEESDDARKAAQSYFFSVDDEKVLDPTNKKGELDATLPFLGFLSVDTLMARVNEPPLGGDVNLRTDIVAGGVTVIAERNIFTDGMCFC
jgi:hypothetical protein